MQSVFDRRGEQFAYLVGGMLYTLMNQPTGRLEQGFIVDLEGNPVWRVVGDGIYALDGSETIGYLGSSAPQELAF
jgi:hypothetical protein